MVYEVTANIRSMTFNFDAKTNTNAFSAYEAKENAKSKIARENNVHISLIQILDAREI